MTYILKPMALTGKIPFTSNFSLKRPVGANWWSFWCHMYCAVSLSLFKVVHVRSVRTHFLSCLDLPKAKRLSVVLGQTLNSLMVDRKYEIINWFCFFKLNSITSYTAVSYIL